MDEKNLLALALLKSLNSGSIPAAGVDFTATLTQANRAGALPRVVFQYPNTTFSNDGTVTIHISLQPSAVPTLTNEG